MKLSEFIKRSPWFQIAGESGKWLAVVCDRRAWRFESYFEAQAAVRESCGNGRCLGTQFHRIIEITPESAPPATKISGSYRKMVDQA